MKIKDVVRIKENSKCKPHYLVYGGKFSIWKTFGLEPYEIYRGSTMDGEYIRAFDSVRRCKEEIDKYIEKGGD